MATTPRRIPLVFCVAFVGIGLVAAGIGAALGGSLWSARSGSERAEGRVVELVRVESPKAPEGKGQPVSRKPGFAPVVEYQVEDQTFRIRGHVSSSNPSCQVGDVVGILYPPDRPGEGMIDSFAEQWLAPLIFGGGGLLFTLVGLGMLWSRVRSRTVSAD